MLGQAAVQISVDVGEYRSTVSWSAHDCTCLRACVRACLRACVHVCVHACVCIYTATMWLYTARRDLTRVNERSRQVQHVSSWRILIGHIVKLVLMGEDGQGPRPNGNRCR